MFEEKIICKICGSSSNKVFHKKILNKYKVNYYQCTHCGYLCTENPFWLAESYKDSIVKSDTGIMKRNIKNAQIVNLVFSLYFSRNQKFLDFGWNIFWSDKFSKNLLAIGFEDDKNLKLPQTDWWYFGCYAGQHISFYSELTFKFIAEKYQLNYYRLSSYHLLLEKKINIGLLKFLYKTKIGMIIFEFCNCKYGKAEEDNLYMIDLNK